MRVKIERLSYGGDGVARPAPDEPVVFVARAAPGDEVEVEIVEEKPRYRRGRILEIVRPGADRTEPPCGRYSGRTEASSCGGCHYQHLRYPAQFTAKHRHVREALKRLGGMDLDEVRAPLWPGSAVRPEDAFAYRNKGTFHWNAEAGAFGLVAMDGRTVLPVQSCPLLAPAVSGAYETTSSVVAQLARDDAAVRASVLSLVVRAGTATGETMAVLVTRPDAPADLGERFAAAAWKRRAGGALTSLQINVNPRPDRALFGGRFELLAGEPVIHEKIGALTFVLDAETFLQVNTAQAKRLCDEVVRMARGAGDPRRVLDLYAGNGGLSLALAAALPGAEVLAVESVATAVARGKESAAVNGVGNVRWRAGRVESVVKKLHHAERYRPDVVVADPPRAGLKPVVVETVARMRPRCVVYVSCNPTTLARDVKLFASLGYRARSDGLAVVDLFPQTYHVEAVLALAPEDRP